MKSTTAIPESFVRTFVLAATAALLAGLASSCLQPGFIDNDSLSFPAAVTIVVNDHFNFSAAGGVPPYRYVIVQGPGTLDPDSGEFVAPSSIAISQVRVTDRSGVAATTQVVINPPLRVLTPQIPLTLGSGYTPQIKVSGGVPPYAFTLVSGPGSVDTVTGRYSAADRAPGAAIVEVMDGQGTRLTAQVNTRWSRGGGEHKITTIAQSADAWFISGAQRRINGLTAGHVAALDLSGDPDATCDFQSGFDAPLDPALALAATADSIYVGGIFTSYQGTPVTYLAKIDRTTCALDPTFNPPANTGLDLGVTALKVVGNALFVGGGFTQYRGSTVNHFMKLDRFTGNIDLSFPPSSAVTPGFDAKVTQIEADGNAVYVGGAFTAYLGVAGSASHLAKIDLTTGALDTTFSPPGVNGVDAEIFAFAFLNHAVYIGGNFTAYRGVANSAMRLAKLDPVSGALDPAFTPPPSPTNGFDQLVTTLAIAGGALYVGGEFTIYRGVPDSANFIAKLDPATGALDTAFSPPGVVQNGFNGPVRTIVVNGNSLFAGGQFTTYRGTTYKALSLAKLDRNFGVQDLTFHPQGDELNGFDNAIYGLAIDGTTLFAVGDFLRYGGNWANVLARVNKQTGRTETRFNPLDSISADGAVSAIAVAGSSVFVGGTFPTYRGLATGRLAKLDSVTGDLDLTFNSPALPTPGFDQVVLTLSAAGNSLYAGGSFSTYRGSPSPGIAKIDVTTGALDTAFSPPGDTGFNAAVRALVVYGGAVYVGGDFTSYTHGGVTQPVNYLAKLDALTGALDTAFSPPGGNGVDQAIYAITSAGGAIYIGGVFTNYLQAGGQPAAGLAKLDPISGALDVVFSPPGSPGISGAVITLTATANSLYAGGEFNGYRGVAVGNLAKVDRVTGDLDLGFSTPPAFATFADPVYGIGVSADTVAIVGDFSLYRGAPTSGMIWVDPVTGTEF